MVLWKKILKSKALYLALALAFQAAGLVFLLGYFSHEFLPVYYTMIALSVVVSIIVINRDSDTSSKILWVFVIMALPFFGGLLYLLFGGRTIPKKLMIRDRQAYSDYKKYALQNMKTLENLSWKDPVLYKMASMAWNNGYFPMYHHAQTVYYKTGMEQFEALLEAIKSAKEYIFIETYIIDEGYMWEEIHKVLKKKVEEGVDVRLIYDDFGSILNMDEKWKSLLESEGIQVHAFNPIIPQLAIQMNNRDHRKIIVVDGKTAFTGGSNIADEYINRIERFGYWKDMGICLKGEAVEQFVISFLQIWNYGEEKPTPYEKFVKPAGAFDQTIENGFVIPFSDSPTDRSNISKNFHLNLLSSSVHYCWISTPYLILDAEMEYALTLAVNNGVDVRIVVPAIPDKQTVYQVTRANYAKLLDKGVRIYEYTPGFIHGKVTISDDRQALVGTVNMDFRSYYHNYECGVWMEGTDCLEEIKSDFAEIFAESKEVTKSLYKQTNYFVRLYRSVLKIFSPLM
ncbi:MAG: cardiolipin synthase [Erysipelotrichaceae bacterium]|nr:cardiolipin synthase [Erysipelotrichaceae bacterium]